ncbi:hypothetical protein GGF46_000452 [Coemansia sp. RSA 552]|nr:hypothetical protein GGF46_000452 [Coemansia sp. RSA 552]
MSELVHGVKLKFELPFKLPAPVSFPFELIGDFRPITRIPKYDYSLEKKIMKDIVKQKQEDQFNMLKQAQQQLSMVDLIASRKSRHKGKEPDRTAEESRLQRARSESGASKQSASAAGGPHASTSAGPEPLQGQPRPQQAPAANDTKVDAAPPVDTLAVDPSLQAERPHSAGPGIPLAQTAAGVISTTAAKSQEFPLPPPGAAQTGAGPGSAAPSQPIQHAGPAQYVARPGLQPRPKLQFPAPGPPRSEAGPGVGPMGFVMPQRAEQHYRPGTIPGLAAAGTNSNVGFTSMVELPLHRPQQGAASLPASVPIQPNPHSTMLNSGGSSSSNNRLSASFGVGPPASNPPRQSLEPSPLRPALPPKPAEWQNTPNSGVAGSLRPAAGSSMPPPVPPRRAQPQQDPAAPAIPPKPFTTFSEFDYEADGQGSSDSAGHVEQLNTLLSMGFSRPQAIHALEMYDYDVNKASNYLIDKAL